MRHQIARRLLPDEAHRFSTIGVHGPVAQLEQILMIHPDATGRGPIESAQDVEQRRFTAAARADNAHQFPGRDG